MTTKGYARKIRKAIVRETVHGSGPQFNIGGKALFLLNGKNFMSCKPEVSVHSIENCPGDGECFGSGEGFHRRFDGKFIHMSVAEAIEKHDFDHRRYGLLI